MTGFGTGEAALGAGVLRVELKSVNHRHLDLRVRCVEPLEVSQIVEDVLRARLGRGHVEAGVRWEVGAGARGSSLDSARAREIYLALCVLRDELCPGQAVPIEAVLSAAGVVRSVVALDPQQAQRATVEATQRALASLVEMRTLEGAGLKRDLLERASLLREHAGWIEKERPRVLSAARDRLVLRVSKLLEGTDIAVDTNRLTQEVAWFADRSDIAEEITRLGVHLGTLEQALSHGGAVGRKLDFLVQELGREINTIGSKANDGPIAQRVVEMKAELERIREQVQNIL